MESTWRLRASAICLIAAGMTIAVPALAHEGEHNEHTGLAWAAFLTTLACLIAGLFCHASNRRPTAQTVVSSRNSHPDRKKAMQSATGPGCEQHRK